MIAQGVVPACIICRVVGWLARFHSVLRRVFEHCSFSHPTVNYSIRQFNNSNRARIFSIAKLEKPVENTRLISCYVMTFSHFAPPIVTGFQNGHFAQRVRHLRAVLTTFIAIDTFKSAIYIKTNTFTFGAWRAGAVVRCGRSASTNPVGKHCRAYCKP